MIGDIETQLFWTAFVRHLCERGVTGVRLVIGGHHAGLFKAIRKVLSDVGYQRRRVHPYARCLLRPTRRSAKPIDHTIGGTPSEQLDRAQPGRLFDKAKGR